MNRIVLSLTIIAALSAPVIQAEEKLKILSTIKPIHSLVLAITGDLAESAQVIPNHASPHHYSLKPSDLRKISSADLIFRIDPNLEGFLQKSLRSVDADKVISLSESTGLTLLKATESHVHTDSHEKESQERNTKDFSHTKHIDDDHVQALENASALDFHLWLNPNNAIAMANFIRDALISIAPKHNEKFTDNTQLLIAAIQKKNEAVIKQLENVTDEPFLVMHDAWQYFTSHYQLNQLGSISAQERLKPSAKSISKARTTIIDSKVTCLLAEPNLKSKTLRILTEDLPITITQIDPLGREIPDSDQAYPQLLQYTADKLLNCLKKK